MSRRGVATVAALAVVALAMSGWWLIRSDDPADAGCGSDPEGPSALLGFDLTSGDVRWQQTVGMAHGAAQLGDVVITRAASDVLRAHDVQTGALQWCQPLEPAAPTLESFAGLAGTATGVAVTSAGDIVSFDADGRELWRTPAPFESVWLYGGDVVWVFEGNTRLPQDRYTALDPVTGEPVLDPPAVPSWHGLMAYGFDSAPTSSGEFEISWIADDFTEASDIDLTVNRSGVEVWRRELRGEIAAMSESSIGPVVVVSDHRSITAYGASAGQELWTVPLGASASLLAPVDRSHLVVPQASELTVLDPATGDVRWTADLGSPGLGGDFSLPGHYSLVAPGSTDTAVGLINANRPATD